MRTSGLVLLALAAGAPLAAQAFEATGSTQIRSVAFEVSGDLEVPSDSLFARVAARGRGGAVGLRRVFSWLPLVPPVTERFFEPLELQRDRERLRRYFVRRGYPDVGVEYDAIPRDDADEVDVVFRIEPGRPVRIRSISLAWSDSAASVRLDPDAALDVALAASGLERDEPLDTRRVSPTASVIGAWLEDRGHPFANVTTRVTADSAAATADVAFLAAVGPRARIRRIVVEGNETLPEQVVRDYLLIEPGDWFSGAELRRASRRLTTFDIVDGANFDLPDGQPADTLIDVRLRVSETVPHLVSGQAGYTTEGGLGGEAEWTDRDLFSIGQRLTASLSGQSGLLALPDEPDKFIRGSLTLRQPIRAWAPLTLVSGPFTEYRDDARDRSVELGVESTLIYQFGTISNVALQWKLSTRRIFEYRFGDLSGGVEFLQLLALGAQGILDSLGARINTSEVSVSATFGSLDSPIDPRRGYVIQPSVSTTLPDAWSTNEYLSAALRASGYVPLTSRLTLAARLGGGKLFPRGASVPESQDTGLAAYFRLRDVLFTGGGTRDTRGWADGLLGPKFPNARLVLREDGTGAFVADRYAPIGGFNKLYGTLELRGPVPFLGDNWGSHIFADAGRVWTRDDRFTDPTDTLGVEKLFWSLGGGLDFATPVGAIRLELGYKMNPSILDLVKADDLLQAILNDVPFDQLERHNGRRLQIHLAIGRRL